MPRGEWSIIIEVLGEVDCKYDTSEALKPSLRRMLEALDGTTQTTYMLQ